MQIRCLGEAEMAPAWVVAPARSPPWVGELGGEDSFNEMFCCAQNS